MSSGSRFLSTGKPLHLALKIHRHPVTVRRSVSGETLRYCAGCQVIGWLPAPTETPNPIQGGDGNPIWLWSGTWAGYSDGGNYGTGNPAWYTHLCHAPEFMNLMQAPERLLQEVWERIKDLP